jgi:hypothetical protein
VSGGGGRCTADMSPARINDLQGRKWWSSLISSHSSIATNTNTSTSPHIFVVDYHTHYPPWIANRQPNADDTTPTLHRNAQHFQRVSPRPNILHSRTLLTSRQTPTSPNALSFILQYHRPTHPHQRPSTSRPARPSSPPSTDARNYSGKPTNASCKARPRKRRTTLGGEAVEVAEAMRLQRLRDRWRV